MARACGMAAEGEARRRRARARARYLSLELAHGRVVVDVDGVRVAEVLDVEQHLRRHHRPLAHRLSNRLGATDHLQPRHRHACARRRSAAARPAIQAAHGHAAQRCTPKVLSRSRAAAVAARSTRSRAATAPGGPDVSTAGACAVRSSEEHCGAGQAKVSTAISRRSEPIQPDPIITKKIF